VKSMKVTPVTRADSIQVGNDGRAIDVTQAPIRLIATRWLYDRATRTLFSSDMFTHVWRDTETGPWIVTETDSNSTSPRDIRSFMLNTRYCGWKARRPARSAAASTPYLTNTRSRPSRPDTVASCAAAK